MQGLAEKETGKPGRPATGARIMRFDRAGRRDPEASRLVGMVAASRGVPPLLLLHRSRCAAEVAAARQLAMYLMHVALGRDYAAVGRYFRRDRTTVAYACRQIEDARDDTGCSAFEIELRQLEAAIADAGTEARRAAS